MLFDRSRLMTPFLLVAGLMMAGVGLVELGLMFNFFQESVVARAEIISVHRETAGFSQSRFTGTTPNQVFRVGYRYEVGGQTFQGQLTSGWPYREGESITVQYVKETPEISRILAPRSTPYWLGILFLTLLGGLMALSAGISGWTSKTEQPASVRSSVP